MELKLGLFLTAALMLIATLPAHGLDILTTKPSIKGMLDGEVDLVCSYQPSGIWFVLQWKRRFPNNTDVTLVSLPYSDGVLTPTWSDDKLKHRGRTNVSRNNTVINFNVNLYEFQCTDVGTYECAVTGTETKSQVTEVGIVAVPGQPSIYQDLLIVEENHNFTIECVVSLGIPPARVRWYVKHPDNQEYMPLTSVEKPETLKSSTCVPRISQDIVAAITEETSGSLFQCRVEGSLIPTADHQYNDEIVVQTPAEIVTEAPYEVPCTGKNCNVNKTAALGLNGSQSKSGFAVTMVMSLFTFFSVYALR